MGWESGYYMKYPIFATDLDGTILNDEKQIDIETISAIQEYRQNRGKVVVCTGRSPLSATWIARTMGLTGEPIIAYNGAVILDESGQTVENHVFLQDTLLQIWKMCEKDNIYVHFYEGNSLLVPVENEWNKNWARNNIPLFENSQSALEICNRYRRQIKVTLVKNFYDYFQKEQPRISKIALFHEGKELVHFSKKLTEHIDNLEISSSSNYRNLEIAPKGITKASGLLKVVEKQGLSIKQAAAIGDNFNDGLMLASAGLGIAMGNAPEEIKKMADVVTTTNNHEGVALAIRHYLLSEVF